MTAAWREANDSFTTNSHYSIMPLRVCETLVLSVLRHELALGSRGLLESAKPKPAYGGSGDASPIEERNEGPDEISKL